jgi:superfamily II DNA/RNA helicase
VTFDNFGLKEGLLSALQDIGFEKPTDIQSETIKPILEGKDIFAMSETGSGKTGSFAIPIIEKILRSQNEFEKYLVLSPTRELAQQTASVINQLGATMGISSACLIGGEKFEKQQKQVETAKVYVATPGRFCDFVKQKFVPAKDIICVVFDEADRLFEMGFQKDIEFALSKVQKDRQLVMVSATSNMEVLKTAYKFHSEPLEIKLNHDDLLVDNINHEVAMICEDEKMPYLVNFLRKRKDDCTIIFCNTQYMTHLVSMWLNKMDFKSMAISGKLAQNRRTKLMESFRNKEITTLVCTDVAARGLDIDDVNLVVNYDLPNEAANYVHRIGRTGRAGKEGYAISFCGENDGENLDAIYTLIEDKINKIDIEDEDFATDLVPRPKIDSKTLKEYSDKKPKKEFKKNKPKKEFKKDQKREKDMTERKRKVQNHTPEKIKTFEIETTSEKDAKNKALRYFKLMDDSLLKMEVLSKGSKKFIFFGPRKVKYSFSVTPIFKRMLLPFLIKLIKKMGLNVYVRVSFKEPEVRINISGKDIKAFMANKFALKRAVEQLALVQLRQKIYLSPSIKVNVRLDKEDNRMTEAQIIELVEKTKAQIIETKEAKTLNALNPADRRIVHQAINDDARFESNSIGDGRFKKIEISLKA